MWFNCLGINSYGKNTWKWAISLGVVDLLGMGYRITNVFIYCDQKKQGCSTKYWFLSTSGVKALGLLSENE